jgi:hypothetical protein
VCRPSSDLMSKIGKEELKLRQLRYFFAKVSTTSERRILHRILRKRYVR